MANRNATTAFKTEIAKDQSQAVHLVEIYLDSATYYLTDAYIAITYDSNEYGAAGFLLGFTSVSETNQIMADKITVSLSGVDRTYTNLVLTENYIDRRLVIRKAFLDSSDALIADPIIIFDGRMDNPTIMEDAEGGRAIVSVSASNQFVNFEKINGRYTNNESQKLYYNNDLGFNYASQIIKDVVWGAEFDAGTRTAGAGALANELTGASTIDDRDFGDWSVITGNFHGGILSTDTSVGNFIIANEVQHGRSTSDVVTISGALALTDIPATSINIAHTITVINDNQWKAPVSETVTVTVGQGGGDEILFNSVVPYTAGITTQTTSGSENIVTVTLPNNELQVDDSIEFGDTGDIGGIPEEAYTDIRHTITSVETDYITVAITEDKNATAPSLSTDTDNDNIVTVKEADHGRSTGDTVLIAGAVDIGGVAAASINTTVTITTIPSVNEWNFAVSDTVTSTVANGGGDSITFAAVTPKTPTISTTSGSTTITIHQSAHGMAVGNTFSIFGSNPVAGIPSSELNTTHTVVSVPDVNSVTVVVSTSATATSIGGGRYTVINLPVKATSEETGGARNTTRDYGFGPHSNQRNRK